MNLEGMDVIFENDRVKFVASEDYDIGKELVRHYFHRDLLNYYKSHDVYFLIKLDNQNENDVENVITIITNDDNYNVFDRDGIELSLEKIFFEYEELIDSISDIIGPVDLMTTLTLIEAGRNFTDGKMNRIDSLISSLNFKPRAFGSSKIYITFDYVSAFFDLLEFEDEDKSYIESVLNSYDPGNIFSIDGYDEFKEGYIFRYFDEDNEKLLNQIVSMVYPNGYDYSNDDIAGHNLAEFLIKNFDRESTEIQYSYEREMTNAAIDSLREELYDNFCDVFESEGINIVKKHCFEEYWVYVSQLKQYLIDYKSKDIEDLIKKIAENKINARLRYEGYEYIYNNNGINHSGSSFNSDVTYELEKIIDKIQDNPIKYNYSEDNKNFIEILQKYPIYSDHKLDGDRGHFTIKGFKNGRLLIKHYNEKNPNGEDKSFSSQEFYNFLSTGELFERLVRKLKKLL